MSEHPEIETHQAQKLEEVEICAKLDMRLMIGCVRRQWWSCDRGEAERRARVNRSALSLCWLQRYVLLLYKGELATEQHFTRFALGR